MATELELLNDFLTGRYRLERELGRGGMATVYLAHDLKHERPVAIKVMHAELSAVLGPERFLREIKLTARLNHPHILPLLDSGEANGLLYYVMPYVQGESVRARLDREKQFPLEDALQIAWEAADALDYAHRQGVVHRDIKPENILISARHAVVADFGIAKAISAAGGEKLTATGLAIGTPAYMSPEQAAGSDDLDGRSDLYSLGCVLFEMLAGQPPFTGPTAASVIHQHVMANPPPVTTIRPAVPDSVGVALAKALAKTPADRFSPAARFGDALKHHSGLGEGGASRTFERPAGSRLVQRSLVAFVLVSVIAAVAGLGWRARQPDPNRRLLVVIPFENRTGDTSLNELGALVANWLGDAILRDGMGEVVPSTIVHDLLRTDIRESARPVEDLARRTGARTAIVGEYRRSGNQIEIRGALLAMPGAKPVLTLDPVVGPASGNSLLPALELRVLEAVQSRFELAQVPRSYSRPSSVEAYREFLRGEQLYISGDYTQAAEHHAKAMALDTGWATPVLYLAFSLEAAGQSLAADSLQRALEQRRDQLPPWDANMLTLVRSDRAGNLSASYQAARRLFEQAPRHWGGVNFASAALSLNRPEEALRVARLRDTSTAIGRQLSHWGVLETTALHRLGRHREELKVALDERRRFAEAPLTIDLEIRARAALNQVGDISRLLDQLTGRRADWNGGPGLAYSELLAHGHEASARSLLPRVLNAYEMFATQPGATRTDSIALVTALFAARDHSRARAVCSHLATTPDGAAQRCMTYLAAREGDRARAISESGKWQRRGPQAPPGEVTYWRAQVAAGLGDGARAITLLHQALAEGYPFISEIHRDIYLESIWTEPGFREFLRPKG